MMQINNLQIAPNGVCPIVHASQYDKGRQIKFLLFDGSVAYTPPTGSKVMVEGIKSDKNAFSYECSWSGNEVTVVLTEQMTVFAEDVDCEIRIISSSNLNIGTINFRLLVEKSPIDENTPISDTEIPAIITLAAEQMEMAEAWAAGTKGGVPVSSSDPQYQNNSKYYSEISENHADEAQAQAELATQKADDAADSAILSESWAVGGTNTRTGEDTNNSWYWALQSQSHASEIEAYIAIIKTLFGTIYLAAESGDRLLTESGDNLIIDY